MSATLEVERLIVRYGGVHALDGLSLSVNAGTLVGLIGPNGAGKTTFVDAVTGFTPSSGAIRLAGREIAALPVHRRARLGLLRTWQSVELFDDLTVAEHLLLAGESAAPTPWRPFARARRADSAWAWPLGLLGLGGLADRLPGELTYGQRKLVGIARALAARPRILLLDEPAAGLDTTESQILGEHLRKLLEHHIGVLLIDHDVGLVASVCDHVYALDFGRVIAEGTCRDVLCSRDVRRAYLGADAA
jgi:branched-chain amino acid transport system ATP-binding protein